MDIRSYLGHMNTYRRVAEGDISLQRLAANLLLSSGYGSGVSEAVNTFSNSYVANACGALAMGVCMKKLDAIRGSMTFSPAEVNAPSPGSEAPNTLPLREAA